MTNVERRVVCHHVQRPYHQQDALPDPHRLRRLDSHEIQLEDHN